MPGEYQSLTHPFGPLFDGESRVLILGSFPSVKSREQAFFYGHPQNRFWPLIAALLGEDIPLREDIEAKKRIILSHHLALWDSIGSCEIIGSSDSSIRNVKANDLFLITSQAPIQMIFCNGAASYQMLKKYGQVPEGIPVTKLPSTSPANAAWSLERLTAEWKQILQYL
ncbi:MAG: DNA-deoxyinosine glycosylase [Firmicutes bacterium]|nr:DNA-deoxyinosine glycosylase [Bacillota bacterium]